MKKLPAGKGMFIWKIKNAEGGDCRAIAEKAQAMGLRWLAVKINSGYYSYNLRQLADGSWVDDFITMLKEALDNVGIELWGWGDAWLLDGKREAEKAASRVAMFGLTGYLIDAEAQAKQSGDRYRQAQYYAMVMRQQDFAVGLCSYRFPEYHMELPWDELLAGCDFHAPQVYWIHGSDPAGQLALSMSSLKIIKDLPFVPAGPAFDEHGWRPTPAELDEFDQAAHDLGCLGEIWWEWDEANDNNFQWVIAAHEWESDDEDDEPVPVDWKGWVELKIEEFEQRLDKLEGA